MKKIYPIIFLLGFTLRAADLPATPPNPFAAELARATVLAKAGKLEEAMTAVKGATELAPDRYEAPALAALIFIQSGMLPEAYTALGTARPLAPVEAKEKLDRIETLIERVAAERKPKEERKVTEAEPSPVQRQAYDNLIHRLAEADKAPDIPSRQFILEQVLTQCRAYLSYWKNDTNAWILYGMVAVEMDRSNDGIKAARYFEHVESSTVSPALQPKLFQLYDRFKQRDWWASRTSGEMMDDLKAGRRADPPKNYVWKNSLEMGFVWVGPVLFSVYETRVADYYAFVQATGRNWVWADGQQLNHPAANITWDEANAFCQWLTEFERRQGVIKPNQFYRLPTDAEWSRAVGLPDEQGATPDERYNYSRSQFPQRFPWGDEPAPAAGQVFRPSSKVANLADDSLVEVEPDKKSIKGYNDGFARTAPVGSYRPEASGLFDLAGNVDEWVADFYDAQRTNRTTRGGNWMSHILYFASSGGRTSVPLTFKSRATGFRCVIQTQ